MQNNSLYTHSVTLIEERCIGCTNCIKSCPTQAIRVRDKKAHIISDKCIDCGECIRVCPYHAKKAVSNQLLDYKHFKHLVALPSTALYVQFNNLSSTSQVASALLDIGFDSCYEIANGAELVSDATSKIIENMPKPVISSACPAIMRIISARYPELVNNVLPLVSPAQLTAKKAKEEISAKTGLHQDEIGCIFIAPCPAKITDIINPIGSAESFVDGAVAIKDLYASLVKALSNPINNQNSPIGKAGLRWASSGGESASIQGIDSYLSCDGIKNVLKVLSDLEDEKFTNLDFVELSACPAGCVGGVLTVENPYIARTKLLKLRKDMPEKTIEPLKSIPPEMLWDTHLSFNPVFELKGNLSEKFQQYKDIEEFLKTLPGLDCGGCGAPTCRSFAQDVVEKKADAKGCIINLKRDTQKILNTQK